MTAKARGESPVVWNSLPAFLQCRTATFGPFGPARCDDDFGAFAACSFDKDRVFHQLSGYVLPVCFLSSFIPSLARLLEFLRRQLGADVSDRRPVDISPIFPGLFELDLRTYVHM